MTLITIVIYIAEMKVNFIYSYSVDMEREQEGFFIVTPPQDIDLNFKFEITSNPNDWIIRLQLFVGKSEHKYYFVLETVRHIDYQKYWLLVLLVDGLLLISVETPSLE
jgi:hypothetical protein